MKQYYLYTVIHKENATIYIGWTSQKIKTYWSGHVARANRPMKNGERKRYFYRALSKYGKEAFDWTIIQAYDSEEESKLAEIYWISYLKSFGLKLYNETDGGDGITGHKHTDESKQKIREAHTGANHYSYGWLPGTHPNYGKRLPELSEQFKGENNPFYGKTHTEEWKMNNSLRNKRLSQEQADTIRQDYFSIKSQRALAKKYGVSYSTINSIISGKRY